MHELNAYTIPNNLYDFAFIPDFESRVQELASMVEPEDWDYKHTVQTKEKPILYNYLHFTYKRIAEEGKVAISDDEKFACWNTGLVTVNQEPVYMVLEENKFDNRKNYWHFHKFLRKGEWGLNRFITLPEMANYYEDTSQLVYDIKKELSVNIEHIIQDNRERFPEELQSMHNFGLQNLLKGAIDSVLERVKRNYKTAIPQYYNGSIQLLLPLCLTEPSKADLALVVERYSECYRASTCLTLDMAYNNARQVARPDRDWLQP